VPYLVGPCSSGFRRKCCPWSRWANFLILEKRSLLAYGQIQMNRRLVSTVVVMIRAAIRIQTSSCDWSCLAVGHWKVMAFVRVWCRSTKPNVCCAVIDNWWSPNRWWTLGVWVHGFGLPTGHGCELVFPWRNRMFVSAGDKQYSDEYSKSFLPVLQYGLTG